MFENFHPEDAAEVLALRVFLRSKPPIRTDRAVRKAYIARMKGRTPPASDRPECFGEIAKFLRPVTACEACQHEEPCNDISTENMWIRECLRDGPSLDYFEIKRREINRQHQAEYRERKRPLAKPVGSPALWGPSVERRLLSQLTALEHFVDTGRPEHARLALEAIRLRADLAWIWRARILHHLSGAAKSPGRGRLVQLLANAGYPLSSATVGRRMALLKELAPFLAAARVAINGRAPTVF